MNCAAKVAIAKYSPFTLAAGIPNISPTKDVIKAAKGIAAQTGTRNLLLNQLKLDLISEKRNHLKNNFDCKNVSHVVAELFYITANALSTRSIYSLSNYYVNLAKYLNQNFFSYNTLLAENFVMKGNYERAKEIYLVIKRSGEIYSWHSSKQVALLELQNNKTNEALNVMQSSYNKLSNPNLYQTYDFASFPVPEDESYGFVKNMSSDKFRSLDSFVASSS